MLLCAYLYQCHVCVLLALTFSVRQIVFGKLDMLSRLAQLHYEYSCEFHASASQAYLEAVDEGRKTSTRSTHSQKDIAHFLHHLFGSPYVQFPSQASAITISFASHLGQVPPPTDPLLTRIRSTRHRQPVQLAPLHPHTARPRRHLDQLLRNPIRQFVIFIILSKIKYPLDSSSSPLCDA
jgi:hypothetical protein